MDDIDELQGRADRSMRAIKSWTGAVQNKFSVRFSPAWHLRIHMHYLFHFLTGLMILNNAKIEMLSLLLDCAQVEGKLVVIIEQKRLVCGGHCN